MAFHPEQHRPDFPILDQRIGGRPPIYLDSACISLKPTQVVEASNEYYTKACGCHGRVLHTFGRQVTERYDAARKAVAKFINAASPEEVVFTRNSTEGLNLVTSGLPLRPGNTILLSDIEHNSNLLACQRVSEESGVGTRVFSTNEDTTFSWVLFEEAFTEDVKLVSILATSNLSGVRFPVEKIAAECRARGVPILVDAAQTATSEEIDVRAWGVDFLVFSLHKMPGPSGVGVLYGRRERLDGLDGLVVGGETVSDVTYNSHTLVEGPGRFEAGLQNYAGIFGVEAALEYVKGIGLPAIHEHKVRLNGILTEELVKIDGLSIIGPEDPAMRGGILNFTLDGFSPHDLSELLDRTAGVMVRSGKMCVHSWYNVDRKPDSVRVSLYLYNTEEECRVFLEHLGELARHFRRG